MKSFLLNTAIILTGALLFAASFPNPLITNGLPLLAWIAYVPVFWVIRRSGGKPGMDISVKANLAVCALYGARKTRASRRAQFAGESNTACPSVKVSMAVSALWGALYGYAAYRLFAPWLDTFHPKAGITVSLFQMCYMAVLFPLLKLALILYPKKGYLLQWLLWLSYEYLKTLGFLGFPYGITGYTQWQYPAVIGIASVFGVWGVSALVLFPSVYLGAAESCKKNLTFFRRERLSLAVWLGTLGAALVFGFVQPNFTKESIKTAKIALIQQNADPWKDESITNQRAMLKTLISLSRKALEQQPDTELVVWPETAFIPRIFWHLTYRDNPESYELVKELMDFLTVQKVPFIIGNDDARLEVGNTGRWERVDYNGALLFEGEALKDVYRKMHLVPFAEYFPYKKTFPRFYKTLVNANTRFWKPGKEPVVFTTGRLRFSAPICFEDCFGYISRNFTQKEAQFIVNLTNDAWAESLSCQVQHLSMAVFRAVENRRSLVRAATSGQTCAIDPWGKILAAAPPFTETALNTEIPLLTSRTPYVFWGDLWGILFSVSAIALLLNGLIRFILNSIKAGRKL